MFDAAAIAQLAQTAKLASSADTEKYGQRIRDAARQYLADSEAIRPLEHRDSIKTLAHMVRRALDGGPSSIQAAAEALDALHPTTLTVLQEGAWPRHVPTGDDLLDASHGRVALILLYGLCHRGAEWKMGRKRPGGKRSAPTLTPLLADTNVRVGRPRNDAEFMLCTQLGIIYYKATKKMPPRRADARKPGPFVRLVDGVLRLLGAPGVNAAELVEAYGAYRRK